jgi:riboflavin kinase/FMN adenylyltransferase
MRVLTSFAELSAMEETSVFATVGFFDGVHRGHQQLIRELQDAARAAGVATLAITFSNSPRNYHRPPHPGSPDWRYLTTADEKLALLAATGLDWTLNLTYDASIAGQSAAQFLRLLLDRCRLSGLCVGYDTSIGRDMVSGFQQFSELTRQLGLQLVYVEPFLLDGVAVKSSLARELLEAARFDELEQILGHPYSASGTVVAGKGRGAADLDTPTANLLLPVEKMTPPAGIYAGTVVMADGTRNPASLVLVTQGCLHSTVLERGGPRRPLPGDAEQSLSLEAHLLDYAGDLYGQRIKVEFARRIRDWQTFDCVEELRERIERDVAETRAALGQGT